MKRKIEATRIALDTLGCKLNQAETELLAGKFAQAGYRLVPADEAADIYILNTCTVTHIADRKSRHLLRQAHRRNPGALVIATGCYTERAAAELTRLKGVGLVLGNEDKANLIGLLEESGYLVRPDSAARDLGGLNSSRNRSFIKVQDGCDSFCTYCIVPLVRTKKMSLPAGQVVALVKLRLAQGIKEVVITGTEIGSYSHNGIGLAGLIQRLLAETDVVRLRLSSLQPQELSPGLIELWSSPRLCRHLHLSLQSGSDSVLKRMRRRYLTYDFKRGVSLIRSLVPEAAITTDIIVGFPSETEDEFDESYQFCQKIGFARIHVFPYSSRPGTAAAGLPEQISSQVKKQRSRKMLALARESARNFRERFLGKVMPVLWEQKSNGIWSGLTDNYIRVYTRSDDNLSNQLLPVKLVRVYKDGMMGGLT